MCIMTSHMVFLATAAIEILTNVLSYVQEGKLGRSLGGLGRLLLLPSNYGLLQNHAG